MLNNLEIALPTQTITERNIHIQSLVGWGCEKGDLVEDVPAYCRWDQMAFKSPFQPKPFHDTKISKSKCRVHLQRLSGL